MITLVQKFLAEAKTKAIVQQLVSRKYFKSALMLFLVLLAYNGIFYIAVSDFDTTNNINI